METLSKLESMLQDHIKEEENEIFKLGRGTISDARAEEMGEEYQERKQKQLG
jgi:hemerythrin-like domain-containing protein